MIQISSFPKSQLRNGAHFTLIESFLALLKAEKMDQHEDPKIADGYASVSEAFEEENRLFRISLASEHTEELFNADYDRDQRYSGIKSLVKGLSIAGSTAQKAAAKKMDLVLRKYNVNTSAPYDQESGVLTNLIGELETLADSLSALALTQALADLKSANNEVKRILAVRSKQLSDLAEGQLKIARAEVDKQYDELVLYLNAKAVIDDDGQLESLFKQWNTNLSRVRTQDIKSGAAAKPGETGTATGTPDAEQTDGGNQKDEGTEGKKPTQPDAGSGSGELSGKA